MWENVNKRIKVVWFKKKNTHTTHLTLSRMNELCSYDWNYTVDHKERLQKLKKTDSVIQTCKLAALRITRQLSKMFPHPSSRWDEWVYFKLAPGYQSSSLLRRWRSPRPSNTFSAVAPWIHKHWSPAKGKKGLAKMRWGSASQHKASRP